MRKESDRKKERIWKESKRCKKRKKERKKERK